MSIDPIDTHIYIHMMFPDLEGAHVVQEAERGLPVLLPLAGLDGGGVAVAGVLLLSLSLVHVRVGWVVARASRGPQT